MADRPIPFSDPMVAALLAGRKTQTRRVIKSARVFATPERPSFTLTGDDLARAMQNADRFRHINGDGWFWEADAFEWQRPHTRTGWMAHIGYAPGDRLWVREAWKPHSLYDHLPPREMPQTNIFYLADPGYSPSGSRSRPGIHMPRWASRLTLIVESVKVERLQNISEADALAEGMRQEHCPGEEAHGAWTGGVDYLHGHSAKGAFSRTWRLINGAGSWDENPWVVAIGFRVIRANIDSEEVHNG